MALIVSYLGCRFFSCCFPNPLPQKSSDFTVGVETGTVKGGGRKRRQILGEFKLNHRFVVIGGLRLRNEVITEREN